MSQDHIALYLNALKDVIALHWLPAASDDISRQMAQCSMRVIAQLSVELDSSPGVKEQALGAYRQVFSRCGVRIGDPDLTDGAPVSAHQLEAQMQDWVASQINKNDKADSGSWEILCEIADISMASRKASLERLVDSLKFEDPRGEVSRLTSAQVARLQGYLRRSMQSPELCIDRVEVVPGGYSKQTFMVYLDEAANHPRHLVIRSDRFDSPRETTVRDECAVIQVLSDNGVAVPEIYSLDTSGDVLGEAFIVMSRVEGRPVGDALDVEQGSRGLALDVAVKLAHLHQVPAEAFGADIAGVSKSTVERIKAEIDYFEERWRSLDTPSIALEMAFGWLKSHLDAADGSRSLIHKDLGFHNMLVLNEELTGILDWESACIGNPAEDLGYLKRSVEQICNWQEFLDAYQGAGGHIPSPEEQDFYELWAYTWLTVMILITGALFQSGTSRDLQLGYVGTYMNTRLQAGLAAAVNRICWLPASG